MQCTNPITIKGNLDPKEFPNGLKVPCGKCIACRIKKRTEWSVRMLHELNYHKANSFITLTYSDEHLPGDGSLKKRDLQLFFKRLRKELAKDNRVIKYFACGEYGDLTNRPHYHSILFGCGLSIEDRNIVMRNWNYTDWSVEEIKNNSFGIAEQDSIRYVAQYIDKKLTGDKANEVYKSQGREPVFRLLSNGIGLRHCLDNPHYSDNLYITVNGIKMTIPRYYIEKLDIDKKELKEYSLNNELDYIEDLTSERVTTAELRKKVTFSEELAVHQINHERNIQRNKNLNAKLDVKSARKN